MPLARTSKIPRPPNSFMLYRSDMGSRLPPPPPGTTRSQGEVSQMVAKLWHSETPEVRAEFVRRAAQKKAEHKARYPGYTYKPRKKVEVEMERALKAQKKAQKMQCRDGHSEGRTGTASPTSPGPSEFAPHATTSMAGFQSPSHDSYYINDETQHYHPSLDPTTSEGRDPYPELSHYAFEQALQDIFGDLHRSVDFYPPQAPYVPDGQLVGVEAQLWDSDYPPVEGLMAQHASFNASYVPHRESGGRGMF